MRRDRRHRTLARPFYVAFVLCRCTRCTRCCIRPGPGVMNCRECTRVTDSRDTYSSCDTVGWGEKPREKGERGNTKFSSLSRVQVDVLTASLANRSFHFGLMYGLDCASQRVSNYRGNDVVAHPCWSIWCLKGNRWSSRTNARAIWIRRDVRMDENHNNVRETIIAWFVYTYAEQQNALNFAEYDSRLVFKVWKAAEWIIAAILS